MANFEGESLKQLGKNPRDPLYRLIITIGPLGLDFAKQVISKFGYIVLSY